MVAYIFKILIFAAFLSFGSTYIIGTGRGVIKAIETSRGIYSIEEVQFGYDHELYYPELSWSLETDPRFPNGQFIKSDLYFDKVWDTKGYQFTAGTPIVLYQKKNTLVDTKNQRWVLSNDSFGIIHNLNMVANVTNGGKVVLSSKSNNVFQKFYLVNIIRQFIDITNNLPVTAYVHFFGPTGPDVSHGITGPNGHAKLQPVTGPGNYAIIKDSAGNTLAGPYDVISSMGDIYYLPPPGPIPVGTNIWRGYMIDEEGQESNVTYTLTFYPATRSLLGSGSDKYGNFQFNGYYFSGGDCVGDRTYSEGPYSFFHAMLDATGRRLIEPNKLFLQY